LDKKTITLKGDIHFKMRFNTTHGDTNLYWRIIIEGEQYLARSIQCYVATYSDRSYDNTAREIKYHISGDCREFILDKDKNAVFK
jgi:hypothetical protein